MIKKIFITFVFLGSFFLSNLFAKTISLTSFIKNLNNNQIEVNLNTELLKEVKKGDSLSILLDENESITFFIESIEIKKNRSVKLKGFDLSKKASILLTYLDDVVVATLKVENESYKLNKKSRDEESYIVFKEDLSKSKSFHEDTEQPLSKAALLLKKNSENNFSKNSASKNEMSFEELIAQSDIINGKTHIDIIILYTQDFLDHYGNTTSTRIQHLLDLANEGFENSKTDVVLNLVHSELNNENTLSENYTIGTALNVISNNADVKALKRKYKADIVTLIRRYKGGGTCGLAYIMNQLSISGSRNASFNVVEDRQSNEGLGYYCSDLTFAHEIGHNFGCAHDRDHSSGSGIFSYSHGYDIPNQFATIMSYDSPEINYFSNPDLTYNGLDIGVPEGNSNSADNTRTIKQTKYYIDNQYLEQLENGEQITGNTISGMLSNNDDRDLFTLQLNGKVTFTNINSYYINIYDSNGYLVVAGGAYNNVSHTFSNGEYNIIVSSSNDSSGYYYNNINESYSIGYIFESPIANAGLDQTVQFGDTVTFDASKSTDMNGSIVSYEWKEGNSIISTSSSFSKSDFSIGVHTIVLKVVDNQGNTGIDEIVITVTQKDTDNDSTPDSIDLDDDNDGMPDTYENSNGLDSLVDDANLDKDNDGKTNIQEFNDGTKANDPNSKYYNLVLTKGWNLISFEFNTLLNVTDINDDNIEIIRSLQNSKWLEWKKNTQIEADKKLASLEDGYGYWIKSKENVTLNLKADGVATSNNVVADKWQMLGSKAITDINSFLTANPSVNIIWTYRNGQYYARSKDVNILNDLSSKNIPLLNEIKSNEGFFIK